MEKVLNLYKPVGKTPLETLNKLREKHPEYKDSKLAYAGRLDPMAEGILLVLVDDECKKRDDYQNLTKVYETEILFGYSTDTYDILGLVIDKSQKIPEINIIKERINDFPKEFEQPYPPYSSYHVDGKPLFQWSKEGKINQVKIPTKKVKIKSKKILESYKITSEELLTNIKSNINSITSGEFRQEEILSKWEEELTVNSLQFTVVKVEFEVTSGTYIRSIANQIGKDLNVASLALSIKRTKVEDFRVEDAVVVF